MEEKESPPICLSALPVELIDHMTSFLPNRDIKSLRLTSRSVHDSVTLRLIRVFISANPLNIGVVEEVANHERFRKGVTEIIWDEAYFGWRETTAPDSKYKTGSFDSDLSCPNWYFERGCAAIRELAESKGNDTVANRPALLARMRELAAAMTPGESYHYYYELVKQERWMLTSGAVWKVFEYALDRFPSLRRITISTKAYGKLFMPRYETPLIRSFPYGFVYALPGPWSFPDSHQTSRMIWKDKDASRCNDCGKSSRMICTDEGVEPSNEYRVFRRGLCSALRGLAKHGKHKVSEFIVEDHEEREHNWVRSYKHWPQDEYTARMDYRGYAFDDLRSLIQRPGFQRLSLNHEHCRELFKAFEEAESLRSLCLYGNKMARMEEPVRTPTMNDFLTLPECLVQRLQSLVLDRVLVLKYELIAFLDSLISLQSLELRSVAFEDYGGDELMGRYGGNLYRTNNPRDFLFDLREKTGWRDRCLRPTVTIILPRLFVHWPRSQTVRLDSEIGDYLYRFGENPFTPSEYDERYSSTVWRSEKYKPVHEYCAGKGTVMMEELDPASERPNVDSETLEHLGIISIEETKEQHHLWYHRGNGPHGDAVWGDELWGNGPWGDQTCPTLQEQGRSGRSETASASSPSCLQKLPLVSSIRRRAR